MTKFFETPFAQAGNKTVVPDALQPDGSVSYTEGWGSDYELDNDEPDYKPIGREQTNQMFFDITEALGFVQRQGVLFWDATFAYSQYARTTGSDGKIYKAVIANTGNDPTVDLGTNWVEDQSATALYPADAVGTDALVLTTVTSIQAATAYFDGMIIQWTQSVANTGAMTVNLDGIGVVSLVSNSGVALTAGEVVGGCFARYSESNSRFELIVASGVSSKVFTSSEVAITSSQAYTFAHGLGSAPDIIQMQLVCQTANSGYVVGEVVTIESVTNSTSEAGCSPSFDATNVYLTIDNIGVAFQLLNKSTGVHLTIDGGNTSWKVRMKAVKI